jgi:hypothetical protein
LPQEKYLVSKELNSFINYNQSEVEMLHFDFFKIINMTAIEFVRSKEGEDLYVISNGDELNIANIMIKFAKIHVKSALEQANKNAKIGFCDGLGGEGTKNISIDKNSILDAYPLTNIK